MKERACQFGENGSLQGVVTLPEGGIRPAPAIVLVSAGLTAKSGPYRLYAQIARTLSQSGFMTLRFDLGGIGSSQIARPDQTLAVRTECDITAAFAYLASAHGTAEFVVGGLCSGAEDAFRHAERDPRVRGVILVDPHAYETAYWRLRGILTRYSVNRIVYRILRTTKAIDVVEDSRNKSHIEGFEGSLINYRYMEQSEAARILSALVERGTNVHYIYTGGRIDTFHHRNQFPAMFPDIDFRSQVTLDFLPHIEHVQVFAEDRNELVDTFLRRISTLY